MDFDPLPYYRIPLDDLKRLVPLMQGVNDPRFPDAKEALLYRI